MKKKKKKKIIIIIIYFRVDFDDGECGNAGVARARGGAYHGLFAAANGKIRLFFSGSRVVFRAFSRLASLLKGWIFSFFSFFLSFFLSFFFFFLTHLFFAQSPHDYGAMIEANIGNPKFVIKKLSSQMQQVEHKENTVFFSSYFLVFLFLFFSIWLLACFSTIPTLA
jgi:hypothetical protein